MTAPPSFDALLRPLHFAAKDEFKNLPLVKDLGKTLVRASAALPVPLAVRALVERLDAAGLDEKKAIVTELLALLEPPARAAPTSLAKTAPAAPTSAPMAPAKTALAPRSLQDLKGVGDKVAQALAEKGVHSIEDLLYFLPHRYEDRRLRTSIRQAPLGERVSITGEIRALGAVPLRNGRKLFEMALADDTGVLRLKWFRYNLRHFQSTFKTGMTVAVSGVLDVYQGQKQMVHPDLSVVSDVEAVADLPPIIPIYSDIEGVHQKRLRAIIAQAQAVVPAMPDVLPRELFSGRALPPLAEALHALHLPPEDAPIAELSSGRSRWHERLILEELFLLQLGLVKRRMQASFEPGIRIDSEAPAALAQAMFPFTLTNAQLRVAADVQRDLASGRPMHRLVQGDVGSGKTAVAFLAMLAAVRAKHQAALMAPTELLAEQHYKNAVKTLHPLGVRLGFLSSSTPAGEAKQLLARVRQGAVDVLIGTHSLIQDRVEFASLALAIVDEQHRFGVVQRARLRQKGPGKPPHLLVMTATPIPRTLALTVYGDLDVSIIDELPPGRTPVKTELVRESKRQDLYQRLKKQLGEGRQAYVVYPLVEESEKVDLKDATQMAEALQKEFSEHVVELLHGRMSSDEKERVMRRFVSGQAQLLVSTTVIEVGIDVPNASVMVIEHAERFGLSQLHQLRGRVGRGAHESYCYLVSGFVGEEAYRRLRVLCDSNDGFVIAEEDLAIRGPGDFIGTRQAGLPELGVANLARDQDLLVLAKQAAETLLGKDAELAGYPALRERVRATFRRAEQLALSG